MTDARENTATGSERDALVSETYREIAHDRAPGHLDKTVLDAAAKAVRPRYSLLITWTRPAAWAATIMLSVALVLEFSQTPVLQPPKMDALAPSDAQELKVQDVDLLHRAEEMARIQEGQSEPPAQPLQRAKERVAAPAAAAAISSKSSLQSTVALEDDAGPCDAIATAEPESWLTCIAELEDAGMTDIAREQRALLAEAFPDFDSR
jgi:hypothetical protein